MQTPDEAYGINLVSNPFVQDGTAYFTQTWIEDDEYRSSIYRFDGGRATRVTFGGHEKMPSMKDGSLYYVSYDKEEESLMVIHGISEARCILKSGSISRYTFHGDMVLAIIREKEDREEPFVTGRIRYRADTAGFLRTRNKLIVAGESARDLVSGDFDVVDVSSNGSRVAFISTEEDDDRGLEDVYDLDVETGKYTRLTKGEGHADRVLVASDGTVAYTGHRKGATPWAASGLIFPEQESRIETGMTAGNSVNADLFVPGSQSIIEDSGKYYVIGQEGGASFVYECKGTSAKRITPDGISVRSFHISGGKLAYVYTSHRKPSVLSMDGEYDPNPGVTGVEGNKFQVGGRDAWLFLTSRDAPTVLAVHGGPQTAYGYGYGIEFNHLLANGYNVLIGNPRGSDGYGEEFARGCVGDWGGKDFQDIMEFADHAVSKFGIKDDFAITGGSYGGYMTNVAITATGKFKCAIAERCVSNLMSMCGTSDIGFWFNAVESEVDDPWSAEGMKKLLEMSPVTRAKQVATPTMFIHGEEDYRCPIEQSEQMYSALRLNGVDSQLVRYPGDSHEHARRGIPSNMKDRLERKLQWFNKYMGTQVRQ